MIPTGSPRVMQTQRLMGYVFGYLTGKGVHATEVNIEYAIERLAYRVAILAYNYVAYYFVNDSEFQESRDYFPFVCAEFTPPDDVLVQLLLVKPL